ncbi:hypothetical protein Sgleb_00250 [Streptomyces glebosus]|uniref:Transposase InsH N-terminal domain-containing protein n=1 Tax=Streptomyces glebosus TaxID=249580 RepID=A0A640SLN5_9ACTN|nr:hypothetical protein Sgleb_00250 [Streptomyces glebosus]GHG74496.1 hypothetical protein GCM10010513_48590 [Streptomyces glebosus]
MTTPFESPVPAPGPAPARPGRKLGPIADCVGSSHRAWLKPMRERYSAGGQTLSHLSDRVLLAKSKLSELLRGVGLYPRWEVIYRLSTELNRPTWPLYRLWRQAALDAQKTREWIDRSTEKTTLATAHLSDRQAAEAVRCRIDFKYALGLELEDPGFHHSVLSDFRDRLAEGDRADRLLGLALTRIRRAGLLKGRAARASRPFP